NKSKRMILGLMSGTSLDGLDIALCEFEGSGLSTKFQLKQFVSLPYTSEFKDSIQAVFAKEQIHFPSLSTLNAEIGIKHAELILSALQSWGIKPGEIDLIASHGQTVMHRPMRHGKQPNSTLQIGDGDHIALKTGIITLSDFRQKHVAAGGEGAPLAIYGDYFLFSKKGENRILLNIGGIGNFTFLPAHQDPNLIRVTDTGPGNTLIDACVRSYFPGFFFDKDARLGMQGLLHPGLLKELMYLDFFHENFPKSTGPEYFNLDKVEQLIQANKWTLTPTDLIRTLTEFSVQSMVLAIKKYIPVTQANLYVSGGGSQNPLMMQRISELLPEVKVGLSSEIGIPTDAKEAILFALLANETIMDAGASKVRRLGDSPWVTMGKISLPF
ncbi:MAG: anhydro-N-acetylmuramic acid kinase, partial [Cytophagales bacterium]|nr:anhydro-N-acetylmuramic acid kinase [Cytophagales bacterium]